MVKGPKSTKFDPTNHISAPHLDPVCPIWTIFDMDILLDPTNNPADFLFFSKTKMAAGGQKLNFGSKSHFGLANGSLSSDLDKIWQADTTQP